MYNEAVRNSPYVLRIVPDHFKTREMCEKALEKDPFILWTVPDRHNIQEMCDKTVKKVSWSLEYVPDWFVKQEQIKLCVMMITAMMIGLLNGTKTIKNGRLRRQKLKKS